MLRRVGADELAGGGDDVDRLDAHARRPVQPAVPPVPALQQVAADADADAVPAREEPVVLGERRREDVPVAAGLDRRPHPRGVDGHRGQPREVDEHPAVAQVVARPAVPARAHADPLTRRSGRAHRAHDVGLVARVDDDVGVAVGRARVPDGRAARLLVPGRPALDGQQCFVSHGSTIQYVCSAMQDASSPADHDRAAPRRPGDRPRGQRAAGPRGRARRARARGARRGGGSAEVHGPPARAGARRRGPRAHGRRGPDPAGPGPRAPGRRRARRARGHAAPPAPGAASRPRRDRRPRRPRRRDRPLHRPGARAAPPPRGVGRRLGLPAALHRERQGAPVGARRRRRSATCCRRRSSASRRRRSPRARRSLDELAEVRRTGVAYDREEHTEGISAVAAVVRDPGGPVAAISVPVPTQRFTGNEERYADAVRAAAAAPATVLGAASLSR